MNGTRTQSVACLLRGLRTPEHRAVSDMEGKTLAERRAALRTVWMKRLTVTKATHLATR